MDPDPPPVDNAGMNLLGSMVIPPSPEPWLALPCCILLLALGGAGALFVLEGRGDLARIVFRFLVVLGAVGFLIGVAWAGSVAWAIGGLSGSGPPSVRRVVGEYAYPLHLVAASLGWLLIAGVMALALQVADRVRPWVPAAVVILLALLTIGPCLGEHDRDGLGLGLRNVGQEEGKELWIMGSSWDSPMAVRPEIFPAARWRGGAMGLFAGTMAAAGAGLALGRRVPGRVVAVLSLVAAVSALLWGLCGLLRVEQAWWWNADFDSLFLLEAAYREAAVPPFVALWVAAGVAVIAFQPEGHRSRKGAAPVPSPGEDPSP